MTLQPPPIAPTTGASLIDFMSIALVVLGVLVACFAIPAFRSKFSDHVKEVSTFVNGKEEPAKLEEVSKQDETGLTKATSRKEIDSFNLDIFTEK